MDWPEHLGEYLLLLQILTPFVGAGLLAACCGTARSALFVGLLTHLLLAVSAAALFAGLLSRSAAAPREVLVQWGCALPGFPPGLFDHVVWGVDLRGGSLLAVLPWAGLTARLFDPLPSAPRREVECLLWLGGMQLALVAWDLGSWTIGAALAGWLLGASVARDGGARRRERAVAFLAVQWTAVLLAAGAVAAVAAMTLLASGKAELPGRFLTDLPSLAGRLIPALQRLPSVWPLWEQMGNLSALLAVSAGLLLTATGPVHGWLRGVFTAAALRERIWLTIWLKCGLLWMLRLLLPLEFELLPWVGAVSLSLALLGTLYSAAQLLKSRTAPDWLTAILLWSGHFTLAATFLTIRGSPGLSQAVLVSHLAGLLPAVILLTIDRGPPWRRSGSQQVLLLTVTWMPGSLGLFLLWISGNAFSAGGFWSQLGLTALLAAQLLVLAGLTRPGPLAEEAAPLASQAQPGRTGGDTAASSAPDSGRREQPLRRAAQRILLTGWGILALAGAFLGPLLV